jgi:hypothetical protein
MESLIETVTKNGGKIIFDQESYDAWKERETTVNLMPDAEQKIRPRYKPEIPGSGKPPFVRTETESTSEEYLRGPDVQPKSMHDSSGGQDGFGQRRRDSFNDDSGRGPKGSGRDDSSFNGGNRREATRKRFGNSDDTGPRGSFASRTSFQDRTDQRVSPRRQDAPEHSNRFNDSGPGADRRGSYRQQQQEQHSQNPDQQDRFGDRPTQRGGYRGSSYRPSRKYGRDDIFLPSQGRQQGRPPEENSHAGPPSRSDGQRNYSNPLDARHEPYDGSRDDRRGSFQKDVGGGDYDDAAARQQHEDDYPPEGGDRGEDPYDRKRDLGNFQQQQQQPKQRGYSLEPDSRRRRLS